MTFKNIILSLLNFIVLAVQANSNFNLVVENNTNSSALMREIAGFQTAIFMQKDLFNQNISGLAIAKDFGNFKFYSNTYNNLTNQTIDISSQYNINNICNLFYKVQQTSLLKLEKEYGINFMPIKHFKLSIKMEQYNNNINNEISYIATYTINFGKQQENNLFNIFNRNIPKLSVNVSQDTENFLTELMKTCKKTVEQEKEARKQFKEIKNTLLTKAQNHLFNLENSMLQINALIMRKNTEMVYANQKTKNQNTSDIKALDYVLQSLAKEKIKYQEKISSLLANKKLYS